MELGHKADNLIRRPEKEKYLATLINKRKGEIITCGFVLAFPQSKKLQVTFSSFIHKNVLPGGLTSCTNEKPFSVNI